MKLLLSLSLLAILLGGCATQDDGSTDSSLSDMYDTDGEEVTEEETEDSEVTDEEEIPDSVGPTDIPDDLIPSR